MIPIVCVLLSSANCVDPSELFFGKRAVPDYLDIVLDLLGPGRADQHGAHVAVLQDPRQRHFRQGLTALVRQIVQQSDLFKPLRGQAALFQEASVPRNAAVGGDAIQVLIRFDMLCLFDRECMLY